MRDGIIMRERYDSLKIYVPESLRENLISKTHLDYGHIGYSKVLRLISIKFFWPKMNDDIKNSIEKCLVCQRNKLSRIKPLGELKQFGPATKPFQVISIDTVGGFSGYNSTKQYIHVAIDNFTRYVWTLASRTQSSKDFVNLINYIKQTNKPEMILADRYTGIKSSEFQNYLKRNEIKITFITVNSPQSNGMCERVNQTLTNRLRCKINDGNHGTCWPKLLKTITDEYNFTPHDVTGFPPSYLMFGITKNEFETYLPLEKARENAVQNSQKNHDTNKFYFDKKRNKAKFNEGDKVLVIDKSALQRRKLESIYKGPFTIIKRLSDVLYEVESDKKGRKSDTFHVRNMLKFHPP